MTYKSNILHGWILILRLLPMAVALAIVGGLPQRADASMRRQELTDSLKTSLSHERDNRKRIKMLVDLCDLATFPQDTLIINMLISEAAELRDIDALEVGYCRRLFYHVSRCDHQSIMDVHRESLELLPYDVARGETLYALWYADAYFLRQNNDEECDKLFASVASKHLDQGAEVQVYDKLRALNLYIEGESRRSIKHGGHFSTYDEQVCEYLWQMMDLLDSLKKNYVNDKLRSHILISLLSNNALDYRGIRKCESQLVEILGRLEAYGIRRNRQYLSNAIRLNFYSTMMASRSLLQDERDEYYEKCMKALQEDVDNNAISAEAAMLSSARYRCNYLEAKDMLMPVDSVDFIDALRYLSQKDTPLTAFWSQKRLAELLRHRGEYREASDVQAKVLNQMDTLYANESSDLLSQLQIEMSKVENLRLAQRMRTMVIVGTSILLVIAVISMVHMHRQEKLMRIANKKIHESEEIKNKFFRSVCHEIRTPLNSIAGFSRMLASERRLSAGQKKQFSDIVMLETDRLTDILDELLFMAHMQADETLYDMEPVMVDEIGERLVAEFARKHSDKNWVFESDVAEAIQSNGEQLQRVLRSLMDNAAKHCPEGTDVNVSCHLADGSRMEVRVRDNGMGISLDKHEYIFHSFSKLDEFKPGMGIGLFMCREVVRRLGGTLYIDPECVKGTCMVISLPL